MSQEISAGIIIYRKTPEGPKFLLLYHGGGYWNFPKGKLEEGERSFRAAVREAQEETGILYKDLRFNKDYFKAQDRFVFQRDGDKISKHVSFYLAETRNPQVRLSSEHEGYGWFLYDRAFQTIKHKNLREILKLAYDTIIRQAHDKFQGKSVKGSSAHSARPRRNVRGTRPGHRAPQVGAGSGKRAE
ncbi:MAG: NUDIX domain-containing protein [Nanoarchaeota archaeon]|nr:NUDIX domain-containing protein [Nanoarchaeota archaeon]